MKEKVAVYFRCSTDKQDNSIEDQRKTVADFASKNNMEIVSWFDKDEGRSGTSFEKRPDFMQMIRLVESGQATFVKILVYDVDRWGRPIDPRESTYWEYHCKRFGVDIFYIVDQSVNQNTLAGRLTKVIKQELATDESRKQSLIVRERSKLRAQEGYRVGGFAPYGYKRLLIDKDGNPVKVLEDGERKVEKSQRVILTIGNEKEVQVAKRIFEAKSSGMGERAIANMLNREGIPSPDFGKPRRKTNPSGKWCINTVHSILKNPVYKGDWVYNRSIRGNWVKWEKPTDSLHSEKEWIVVENAHKGIVSKELFDKVNIRSNIASNSGRKGKRHTSPYLLSGLLVCKRCGFNFHGHVHKTKYREYGYYEDGGYGQRGESVCEPFQIRQELVEDYALKQIKKKVLSSVNVERIPQLIKKRVRALRLLESSDTSEINGKLKEINRKIENIKDSIEAGINVDLVKDRLDRLDRERVALEAEKLAMSSVQETDLDINKVVEEIFALIHRFDEVLKGGLSIYEKKNVVRTFIDSFVVDPERGVATCYIRKVPFPYQSNVLSDNRVFTDLSQVRPPA